MKFTFDTSKAVDRLMKILAVEGTTGKEKKIGKTIVQLLREMGVASKSIRFDTASENIPLPTETGNLIVDLPGTIPGPRILLMTHMDTVPLCAGAVPILEKNKIVTNGKTALGGDNRTGCGVLLTTVATLLEQKLPHPPITLLFTVREESGLFGARFVDLSLLKNPEFAFNFDGKFAHEITIGAVGGERWEVEITGLAAHAGVHPDHGISATMVAALAMEEIYRTGWFGKIIKDGKEGTSNVGVIGNGKGGSAGEATNVVTDYVHIRGESRSFDVKFLKTITQTYRNAFLEAGKKISNHQGKKAKVQFHSRLDYRPFHLSEKAPVVAKGLSAVEQIQRQPICRTTNGGLDANWMVAHGIPTITFGAGQNEIHTVKEWIDLNEYLHGCQLGVVLATQS